MSQTTARTKLLSQSGASLVEYALLIGFIATIGIIAIRSLGQSMSSQFSSTAQIING